MTDTVEVDLAEFVLRDDLWTAAKALCEEKNWCNAPFQALNAMGIYDKHKTPLSVLPVGSIVGVRSAYGGEVARKVADNQWKVTNMEAYARDNSVRNSAYIGISRTDDHFTYGYFIIHEAEAADDSDALLNMSRYIRKDVALRIIDRYLSDYDDRAYSGPVWEKLIALGFEAPVLPKAADLPMGSVIMGRDEDGDSAVSVKIGDNTWESTAINQIYRNGKARADAEVRCPKDDDTVAPNGFFVTYRPDGAYNS